MSGYHERVATAMKKSFMVGSLNSYAQILDALQRTFPSETVLREHVATLEHIARATGEVPDNWTLLGAFGIEDEKV